MSKKLKWKWWFAIVVGLCSIIDGILMILSLGWLQTKLATKKEYKTGRNKRYGRNKEYQSGFGSKTRVVAGGANSY